jgi:hypothetical protein
MDTVVVFTRKGMDTIFAQGGSGDWVANVERLDRCSYLVATANAHSRLTEHPESMHAHAFLVGKIAGVKDAPENPGRSIIQLSEYAEIDIPDAWGGQRNPVRYLDLSEIGIDPAQVPWKPFPTELEETHDPIPALTIEEAKRGLSKKLGVTPESIEITIRA